MSAAGGFQAERRDLLDEPPDASDPTAPASQLHKSVSHGIAVLKTAHHVAAAGYAVETEPGAILASEDEPWRARAEPDLAFTLSGEVWPIAKHP